MTTDEELIAQIKLGDDDAFQTLMSRYIKHVSNFVMQYVRSKEEAEDVIQDTFFKTWKHIKKFKDDMKFKPWLFTIARNTSLDYIKKKKMIPFSNLDNDEENLSFADTVSDDDPLPSEIFERKELAKQLSNVMDILENEHRAIMIMHYHEDMTFEEISDVINKPMNTIKSWHHRSLKKIRDFLYKENIDKQII